MVILKPTLTLAAALFVLLPTVAVATPSEPEPECSAQHGYNENPQIQLDGRYLVAIACGPTGGCPDSTGDEQFCIPGEGEECDQVTPVVDYILACYDYKWSPEDVQNSVEYYAAYGVYTAEDFACDVIYSGFPFC